ncbi:ankyrin repeat domain-containing protein [Sphingomonas sp. LB-2]|nr:ankyrin repeat domain-containing protein [Sphingomonas caeni]
MPSKFLHAALAAFGLLLVAAPAHAQHFSDSYQFLEAIRKQDGGKVMQIITDTNGSIIDTKDRSTGEGALHIVVRQADSTWLRYLIQKGANPNIQDGRGNTPMMLAVETGFVEGVQILIRYGANVNLPNSSGETPLIRAVQLRKLEMVRTLLEGGADPDRPDHISGQSARDYARIDRRMPPSITKLLADAPKVNRSAVSGPKL